MLRILYIDYANSDKCVFFCPEGAKKVWVPEIGQFSALGASVRVRVLLRAAI